MESADFGTLVLVYVRPMSVTDPNSGEPLIDLRGVSRHYDIGGGSVKALDEVDLRVRAGEFVVILGASEAARRRS